MNVVLVGLLFTVPIVLFIGRDRNFYINLILTDGEQIQAYLAISSCLGERFRTRLSGGSYDRSYLRTMTNGGPAMSEQIEMEEMLNNPAHEYEEP